MKLMPENRPTQPPKIVSLCVSRAKPITFQGRELYTGIYKEPVEGKIAPKALNLDGDEQADLTVHALPSRGNRALPDG